MLVNTKAKVGVFSIALGAYLPQFPSLVPEFEAQYEAFKKTIPVAEKSAVFPPLPRQEVNKVMADINAAAKKLNFFISIYY